MLKPMLLAGVCALVLSVPAHAALVRLNFSGELDRDNSYTSSAHASNLYSAEQLAYMGGFHLPQGLNPGSAYDFTIQYDSDAVAVGGRFAFDLISGSAGAHSDFSDFTRYAIFQTAGAYTYLNFVFEKTTAAGGTQPIYAIFNIGDNNGDVVNGVLPSTVVPALIGQKNASFEVRGAYVSSRYRGFRDGAGLLVQPAAAIGAVPEPSTWAMMILGFGLSGAALRRFGGRASLSRQAIG